MSHALLILKIYTTFKDVQVMLKHFFDISTGFRYKKIKKSFPSMYRDVHDLIKSNKVLSTYRSTQNHVEIHAINTNGGVILDTQINVFLNTKPKVAVQ